MTVVGVESNTEGQPMEIHIKMNASDKRLLWIALSVVGLGLAWNIGSVYFW